MTGLLPTQDGDAVISCPKSTPNQFHVWSVLKDGQQTSADILSPARFGALIAAEHFARVLVAKNGGRVFHLVEDTSEWEQLPGV